MQIAMASVAKLRCSLRSSLRYSLRSSLRYSLNSFSTSTIDFDAVQTSREFCRPFKALLGDFDAVQTMADVKKNVVVTISSDKGYCGEINTTTIRLSQALNNSGTKYVILGLKARDKFRKDSNFRKQIVLILTELQKSPLNYKQVSVMADDILKNVEYDALRIVFNRFQSAEQFVPMVSAVLSPKIVEREAAKAGGMIRELDSYQIGETKSAVLQNLSEFQFSCVLFNAMLENASCEQEARMKHMADAQKERGKLRPACGNYVINVDGGEIDQSNFTQNQKLSTKDKADLREKNSGGIGIIMRDSDGEVIFLYHQFFSKTKNIEEVESLGVLKVLELLEKLDLKENVQVTIKCDTEESIRANIAICELL